MLRSFVRALALVAAASTPIVVACGPDAQRSAPEDGPAMSEPTDSAPAAGRDSLVLSIHVPDTVRTGEPVPITLRVHNRTDRPVELHLLGRTIAFDIVVTAPDGALVWRRLEGQAVQSILQLRVLGPGEALELGDRWDQRGPGGAPVGPGVYRVQGVLPTDEPEPLRTPVGSFRIVGG